MYALVSLWQLLDSFQEEVPPQLTLPLASLVQASAGYIESYWTYEQANGKSIGFTLFDTADHAHDLKNMLEHHMEAHTDPGLCLEMLRVQKLVGYVPRNIPDAPLRHDASEPGYRRTTKQTTKPRKGEGL